MFDKNVWFANSLRILYQEVDNRAICLRISGLQGLSSALHPFSLLPLVSNPL